MLFLKKINLNKKRIFISLVFFILIPILVLAINTIGTGFKTTETDQLIDAHGVCKQVKHSGLVEYFVPTKTFIEWESFYTDYSDDTIVSECTYYWNVGSWSSCSRSCGGGVQTRTVVCTRELDSVVVDDNYCSDTKPATSRSCNTQSCCTWQWVNDYVECCDCSWSNCSPCPSGCRSNDRCSNRTGDCRDRWHRSYVCI